MSLLHILGVVFVWLKGKLATDMDRNTSKEIPYGFPATYYSQLGVRLSRYARLPSSASGWF